MKKIKLKLVPYKGLGFVHVFRNPKGEQVFVPCSEEEYKRMGEVGGYKHNPVVEGLTWECSHGGTILVDTPIGRLEEYEYCIVGDKAFVGLRKENGDVLELDFPADQLKDGILWL